MIQPSFSYHSSIEQPFTWNKELLNRQAVAKGCGEGYGRQGQWPVGSGQWPLASDQWPAASGQWPMANGLLGGWVLESGKG